MDSDILGQAMKLLFGESAEYSALKRSYWEEDDVSKPQHGGSLPGRSENVHRDFEEAAERFHLHYFATSHPAPGTGAAIPGPIYREKSFIRRYRMTKSLFLRIVDALGQHDVFFTKRQNAAKHPGIAPQLKVAAAIRQLAQSCASDDVDEYLQMGESTAAVCLERFCKGIRAIYEKEWLRPPNEEELELILAQSEARGFPGMIGSIDCMHWPWDKCPNAYKGQYQGKEGVPTIVLEAVA